MALAFISLETRKASPMPTISVSLLNALAAPNASQLLAAKPEQEKDAFAALLAIGAPNADDQTAPVAAKDREVQPPPAAPIEAPIAVLSERPVKAEKAERITARDDNDNAHPPAAAPRDEKNPDSAKPAPVAAHGKAADAKMADDANAPDEKPAGALRGQIHKFSQLLLDLFQALAPVAPPADTGNPAITGIAALAAATPQAIPEPLVSLPPAAPASETAGVSRAALTLDIKSILEQLRQALAGQTAIDNATTPTVTAADTHVRPLLIALKQDVEQLRQLLLTPAPVLPAAIAAAPAETAMLDDIRDLLQNGVELVKSLLPKAKAADHPAATDNALPVFGTQDAPKPALPDLGSAIKSVASEQAAPETAPALSIAPTPEIKPAIAATPVAVQPPVTAASQASTDNPGNEQHDNSAPQTFIPVSSAGQSQPANAPSAPSFARTLAQAAQPVTEQVVFHIKTALADGSSKIRIQLDPAELGKLDIRLTVGADGKTGMVITADNKDTLALLQRDARGLEQALTDAGLKADGGSLSFNLRGGREEQAQDNSQATLNYRKAVPEEEEVALPALSRSYVLNLAEGLNIKV